MFHFILGVFLIFLEKGLVFQWKPLAVIPVENASGLLLFLAILKDLTPVAE